MVEWAIIFGVGMLFMLCVFMAICRWIFRIDEIVRQLKETNRLLKLTGENHLIQEQSKQDRIKRIDWFVSQIHSGGVFIKQRPQQPPVKKKF